MPTTDDLVPVLKKLRLSGVLTTLDLRTREAVDQDLSHGEFLFRLCTDEIERRESKQLELRLRRASFESTKRIDDFEWSFNPQIPKAKVIDLATCHFVERHENAILIGPTGVVTYCYTLLHHWNNWTCASSVPIRGRRLPLLTASIVPRTGSRSRSSRSMIQGACGTTCCAGSAPLLIN